MDESQYCPLCEQSANQIEILSAGMVAAIKQRDEALAKVSALETERGKSQYCAMCNEFALQNQAMKAAYADQDARIAELEANLLEACDEARRQMKHVAITLQERDQLAARLKQLEEQEPVAYLEYFEDSLGEMRNAGLYFECSLPTEAEYAAGHRTAQLYAAPVSPSDDKRDAERYRFLRHGDNDENMLQFSSASNCGRDDAWLMRKEELDQAIDAAIARSKP